VLPCLWTERGAGSTAAANDQIKNRCRRVGSFVRFESHAEEQIDLFYLFERPPRSAIVARRQ